MIIKTTINIKKSLFIKISSIASEYNISKSFIVDSLLRKAIKYNKHKNFFLKRVTYQERIYKQDDSWHHMHVSFRGDLYEKCIDLRKIFKISVSFFFSLAFEKFLNELIEEFQKKKKSDNYTYNYVQFQSQLGYLTQITLLWDIVEPEKLEEIHKIHKKPT